MEKSVERFWMLYEINTLNGAIVCIRSTRAEAYFNARLSFPIVCSTKRSGLSDDDYETAPRAERNLLGVSRDSDGIVEFTAVCAAFNQPGGDRAYRSDVVQ